MLDRLKKIKRSLILPVAVALSTFILVEVNYPFLKPQSRLALFALLGLIIVFLKYPLHPKLADNPFIDILDFGLAFFSFVCCGYVILQTEPVFESLWLNGTSLGNRASAEHIIDFFVGGFALILILEATRRSIGLTLTILASIFLFYALAGQYLPGWFFEHGGYSLKRVIGRTFLHGGVFGVALRVMFTYVFLFVLFGTLLERTGATAYILNLAKKVFGTSKGSPAKVAVIGSGMMGSLSGSAVANTATTGTFTIPLMRSVGFKPEIAGGIEAAASSGGALVPPIMGAAAYMMLEIVEPSVTYLEIIKAALIPAIFYYTALLLIVHFYAKRISNPASSDNQKEFEQPSLQEES
ncbi:TRAP transporter large permease subunit, partial [Candidatus Poribacteria bacterium]|nr:TRAP transporter large permease subunit [Candidatus Poribacteria bacterium]